MNPAWSVIVFTSVSGAAQGLVVLLALCQLMGVPMAPALVSGSLFTALLMLLVGLGASFLHLGHPLRAWRAVSGSRSQVRCGVTARIFESGTGRTSEGPAAICHRTSA